jgi:hypothetical protein
MSKYDKFVSEKEKLLKEQAKAIKEQQQKALEAAKANREIAEKLLRGIVLPEILELQDTLQKNGRKVTLKLNEPTLESHNRKNVLIGIKLLVTHPSVSPGLHLEFSLANGEQKIAVTSLVGKRAESSKQEYPFNAITSDTVQRIVEDFINGLYE